MAGGADYRPLRGIAESTQGLGGELQAGYQQDIAKGRELTQPLIQQQTALASGDRSAAISAAMPMIGPIASGYQAAKANIMNTVPPGAARDQALAQLEVQKTGGISSTMAQLALQAPQILAGVGSGFAGLGMQEAGGAISSYGQAASMQEEIIRQKNAEKANQLGFFGSLAGTVGGALTGGLFGNKTPQTQGNFQSYASAPPFNPGTLTAWNQNPVNPMIPSAPNIYTGGGYSPFMPGVSGGQFWPGR